MSDHIYIVYDRDENGEFHVDTKTMDAVGVVFKYFTNYDQAVACRDYCNAKEYSVYGDDDDCHYAIASIECGDNVGYENMMKIELEKQRVEEERRQKRYEAYRKRQQLWEYASLKSELEGGDKYEIYLELMKKFGVEGVQ